MDKEIKYILVVGLLIVFSLTFFVNITRIVWTKTAPNTSIKMELACLQGGGKVIYGGWANYLRCEEK